jgi:hypothetical protein
LHKLPTGQAEPFAVKVGQLQNSPLDTLLRLALWWWKILAVRYDLGGYRGCGRSRFGPCDKTLFSFAEPATHDDLPPYYLLLKGSLGLSSQINNVRVARFLDKELYVLEPYLPVAKTQ